MGYSERYLHPRRFRYRIQGLQLDDQVAQSSDREHRLRAPIEIRRAHMANNLDRLQGVVNCDLR